MGQWHRNNEDVALIFITPAYAPELPISGQTTTSMQRVLNGDFLVRTEKNTGSLLCRKASNYYEFRSCLRLYLLAKTSIRHLKTEQKVSLRICASRGRVRTCIQATPNSIAACARKQGVGVTFDGVNGLKKHQKQTWLHKGVPI